MRTVIGLFDNWSEARSSVRDLEASGFGSDDVSVVAQGDAMAPGARPESATAAGAAVGAGLGLLAGMAAVVVPGVGIVAAAGPIIATGALGTVGGGLIGSLADAGVPAEHARASAEQIRRGGALVAVRAQDDDAPRAIEILSQHHPLNLNECALPGEGEANAGTHGNQDRATLDAPLMPIAMPAPDLQPTRDNPQTHA